MDLALGELGIAHACLDGVHALPEQVHAELLKAGTGDGCVEVNTLVQSIDLQGGLSSGRQSALCSLCGGAQTAEGTGVVGDVLLVLPLEFLQCIDAVSYNTLAAH